MRFTEREMADRKGGDHEHREGFIGFETKSLSNSNMNKDVKLDEPPNSRLFIVCGKSLNEQDFEEAFSRFGIIEEIWIVKDKSTGESKGITYVKFSKTSEAAAAMEEMNGRCIGSHPRPLKVLIAHSREQGSRRDSNEEERLLRLFVVIPRSMTETELRDTFSQYGDIDYVSIVRDRHTKDSKGFGYVKYHRVTHAAKAFESCDRSFKPVFADPRPPKTNDTHSNNDRYMGSGSSTTSSGYDLLPYDSNVTADGCARLMVIASPTLNHDQLWRLFDLVPGLDYCDLKRDPKTRKQNRGHAMVVYNNPQSAAYAKDKLHGFEYPPGHRLIVKYDTPQADMSNSFMPPLHHHSAYSNRMSLVPQTSHNPNSNQSMPPPQHPPSNLTPYGLHPNAGQMQNTLRTGNMQTDLNLTMLAETLAQANSIIQAAGLSSTFNALSNAIDPGVSVGSPNIAQAPAQHTHASVAKGETYDPSYCSVKLPPPQPLAPTDSIVAERLFIVCQPAPPPIYVMKDIFGRFGHLIDIYMLVGRSCGYAKYADKEAADRAQITLHGQEVCGSRLKVMTADPQTSRDGVRKRIRTEDQ